MYLVCLAVCQLTGCGGCKRPKPDVTTRGATIPTPQARAAYVTNNGSDTISVIDRDGTDVTSVPIDIDPLSHEAPHHLAIDPVAGFLFVALAFPAPPGATKDPHKAHGNAEDKGKLARLDLLSLAVKDTRDVDENPGDVVLTHDRKKVLVTHYDMKRAMNVAAAGGAAGAMFATLQVWDAKEMRKISERALCVAPHGIVTTPDDSQAIVACYGSDELAVVDLTSPTLASARYPLGATPGVAGAPRYGPYSAVLTPDSTRVVVADLEGADVRVFDLKSKRFLAERTISMRERVFMPEFLDAHSFLAPLQGPDGAARIDVDTGTIERRVSFSAAECQNPHAARVSKDGRAYLVCEGDHVGPGKIVEIDPATLAIKKSWIVGVYPDGIMLGE